LAVEIKAKTRTLVFTMGFLGLLTVVVTIGIFFAPPRLFFVAFFGYCLWRWYLILKMPYRIRLGIGEVELRSVLGRRVLSPHQVKSIKKFGGGYILAYDDKVQSLYGNMSGFGEFVTSLKAANPDIELKGIAAAT
jgi:hypothetical protein